MWNKLKRTLQEYPLDDIKRTRKCAKFLEDTLEWWTVFQLNGPDFKDLFNMVYFVDPRRCTLQDRKIIEILIQEMEIMITKVQALIDSRKEKTTTTTTTTANPWTDPNYYKVKISSGTRMVTESIRIFCALAGILYHFLRNLQSYNHGRTLW